MSDRSRLTRRALVVSALVVVIGGGTVGAVAIDRPRGDEQIAGSERRARASPPPPTPVVDTVAPRCVPDPTFTQPPIVAPPELATAFAGFLAHPNVAPHRVGASVWVDGLGEVLAHEPGLALAPASNEKIFTAMGALAVLGADTQLTTEIRLGPDGDLIVVGGGDPTLASVGAHSVAALAEQVQARGVTEVPGALVVDETRHDGQRRASAWQDWQIPAYTGPLSAFMVDRNRWRSDPAYVADPAMANAEFLRGALASRGVAVRGPTIAAVAPMPGTVVASVASAPVWVLVHDMLQRSDNQIADLLLKDVGHAATGLGSLANGAAATTSALAPLCLPLFGVTDDGSGLSRGNARSAREWRSLLQAARTQPWWPTFVEGLPLAGRSGTLSPRLRGTAAEGNVRAKTGTIIGGTALSGYGTTASGRPFVFSVVVNGPNAEAGAGAVDGLVAGLARYSG